MAERMSKVQSQQKALLDAIESHDWNKVYRDLEIHVVNSISDISVQRRYIAFIRFLRVVIEPQVSRPNIDVNRISNLIECMQSYLLGNI